MRKSKERIADSAHTLGSVSKAARNGKVRHRVAKSGFGVTRRESYEPSLSPVKGTARALR